MNDPCRVQYLGNKQQGVRHTAGPYVKVLLFHGCSKFGVSPPFFGVYIVLYAVVPSLIVSTCISYNLLQLRRF